MYNYIHNIRSTINYIFNKLSLGKSWEQYVDEETDDVQSEFVHDRSQTHTEHTQRNYSKAEEIELIAKIVRDLRDIQIGDSRYVLPPSLLALEKQVIERNYTHHEETTSLRDVFSHNQS